MENQGVFAKKTETPVSKKKELLKVLIPAVAALLLVAIAVSLIVILSGFRFDRAEKKLLEEGYTVVRYGKGAPEHLVEQVDENVVASLKATGGPNGEHITVIEFKDKSLAKEFTELQEKANETNYFYTVKRSGKTVIYGWTTAYKIIK